MVVLRGSILGRWEVSACSDFPPLAVALPGVQRQSWSSSFLPSLSRGHARSLCSHLHPRPRRRQRPQARRRPRPRPHQPTHPRQPIRPFLPKRRCQPIRPSRPIRLCRPTHPRPNPSTNGPAPTSSAATTTTRRSPLASTGPGSPRAATQMAHLTPASPSATKTAS